MINQIPGHHYVTSSIFLRIKTKSVMVFRKPFVVWLPPPASLSMTTLLPVLCTHTSFSHSSEFYFPKLHFGFYCGTSSHSTCFFLVKSYSSLRSELSQRSFLGSPREVRSPAIRTHTVTPVNLPCLAFFFQSIVIHLSRSRQVHV